VGLEARKGVADTVTEIVAVGDGTAKGLLPSFYVSIGLQEKQATKVAREDADRTSGRPTGRLRRRWRWIRTPTVSRCSRWWWRRRGWRR
jgi:hypothetical protein